MPANPITVYNSVRINKEFGNNDKMMSLEGARATRPQFNAPINTNARHISKTTREFDI